MLALSLVAGVLVDDAIVEIENIVRHMRMGKTGFQAALDAADEIGLARAFNEFQAAIRRNNPRAAASTFINIEARQLR